jgi:penicillin-binding protein 1A
VATIGLLRSLNVSCPPEAACVTLEKLREGAPLPEAIRIRDRRGALLAEVGGPLRRALSTAEIPDSLAEAFVAVEDRRFWEHSGVDAKGVLRAALSNVREGELTEGASTIPMQLVRTLWSASLEDAGSWRRKIVEARTAPRLIAELGHERVLTLYLNSIYLGNGIYGVERASRLYFGVGVAELDMGQIATLVGITRAPEYYDPRRHPDRAREIRDVVLATLAEAGVIGPDQAADAQAGELRLAAADSALEPVRQRTHFSEAVLRELRQEAPGLANTPALDVYTTLDAEVQARGEAVLEAQIQAIEDGKYGAYVRSDSPAPLEGAAVALDPATGAVLAWIGGRDFDRSEFDRVAQASRQVGSLVKPFLVAEALERGYAIVEPVSADTVPIRTSEGAWLPADHVSQTSLPMREALVRSSNRAAAHLGSALGFASIPRIMRSAGLDGQVPAVPSSALGSFGASLLDMTAAYASLGNGGLRVEPHLIERVEMRDGLVVWRQADAEPGEPVMESSTAFVVLDALRDVVNRGTAAPVRWTGYRGDAAGKTGTTNDGRDAWFIGLTPELVAGVWIGFDEPAPIVEDRGGGALAAPAWGSWMQAIDRGSLLARRRGWVPPRGVEHVRYDAATGEVLGRSCTQRPESGWHEGWVLAGRYDRRVCPSATRRWLDRRLRRVLEPDAPMPIRPLTRERIGIGGN